MQRWFVADGNKKSGPYAPAQLKEMVQSGKLKPDDLVLLEGAQKWMAASSVKGLFPARVSSQGQEAMVAASPSAAAAPRKRFFTLPRKLALLVFLATAGTGAWFYWEAETVKEQLVEQTESSKEAVDKFQSVKDELNQSNDQVKALEKKSEEQNKEIDTLKETILELKKKAEEDNVLTEKLKLRLKDIEASKGPYFTMDRYALATPKEAEESLAGLVEHLVKPTFNDKDKLRAFFRWTTDRIAYDAKGFLSKKPGDNSAEGVFTSRLAVSAGFAALVKKMGELAGLEVEVVNGYAKGLGQSPWGGVNDSSHAWNVVKLDGKWRLIDAAWCAGHVSAKNAFVKHHDETFFLTQPDEFILTHFPDGEQWQLLEAPLSKQTGDKLVQSQIHPFLLKAGFKLSHFLKGLDESAFPSFVAVETEPPGKLLIRQAPVLKTVNAGQDVYLRFESPDLAAMAYQNGGKWVALDKQGPFFAAECQAAEGVLGVGFKKAADDKDFTRVLRYIVEPSPTKPKTPVDVVARKFHNVWYENFDIATKRAEELDKPIFLMAGRDNSAACQQVASMTLLAPAVATLLERHFVSFRCDVDQTPKNLRAHFAEAAKTSESNTIPYLLLLNPKGQYVHGSAGVRSPDDFLQDLHTALASEGVAMPKAKVPELMHAVSALEKALADKKPAEAIKLHAKIIRLPGHHPLEDAAGFLLESAQKDGLLRLQQAIDHAEKQDYDAAQEALTKLKQEFADWPLAVDVDNHLKSLKALKAIGAIVATEKSWTPRAQEYLDHLEQDLVATPFTTMARKAKGKLKG